MSTVLAISKTTTIQVAQDNERCTICEGSLEPPWFFITDNTTKTCANVCSEGCAIAQYREELKEGLGIVTENWEKYQLLDRGATQ
ncbi:hypothetical protein LCGC14_2434460 [marine sediment metagenome]|uniref:Uncharacterized protein n=1 Tax=marine sediment metagenome TaxID=412755 RepID=A0A0F9EEV1_9ZZZZ